MKEKKITKIRLLIMMIIIILIALCIIGVIIFIPRQNIINEYFQNNGKTSNKFIKYNLDEETYLVDSSNDFAEVKEICKKQLVEIYSMKNVEKLIENQLFYFVKVNININNDSTNTFSRYYLSFKKNKIDIKNKILYTNDKNEIKDIFDIINYTSYMGERNYILKSYLNEKSDLYTYEIHYIEDNGFRDADGRMTHLDYCKDIINIKKSDGNIGKQETIEKNRIYYNYEE